VINAQPFNSSAISNFEFFMLGGETSKKVISWSYVNAQLIT